MINRAQIRVGMDVVGSDADNVGRVKEVRDTDFLVDRTMQRDVYIPFSAVRNVTGDRIALNIPAGQVDNMGWMSPPVTGGTSPGMA